MATQLDGWVDSTTDNSYPKSTKVKLPDLALDFQAPLEPGINFLLDPSKGFGLLILKYWA